MSWHSCWTKVKYSLLKQIDTKPLELVVLKVMKMHLSQLSLSSYRFLWEVLIRLEGTKSSFPIKKYTTPIKTLNIRSFNYRLVVLNYTQTLNILYSFMTYLLLCLNDRTTFLIWFRVTYFIAFCLEKLSWEQSLSCVY